MARHKDQQWSLPEGDLVRGGNLRTHQWESIHAALLMDIRDELKRLNSVLHCNNFLAIPSKLDCIVANTKKRKFKRKRKAVIA